MDYQTTQTKKDTINTKKEDTEDKKPSNKERDDVDAVVVGTLAVDLTCNLHGHGEKQLLFTSTPGHVETSIGGVGHNVALASQYHGTKTRLVTEIGEDEGASVTKQLMKLKDTKGIATNPKKRTSRYIAMHDSTGELFAACADMEDGGKMDLEHIRTQIEEAGPKVVFFDGNIETPQKEAVIQAAKKVNALVGFEPASVVKAKRLAQVSQLGVYPNQSVDIITPNRYELGALFDGLRNAGYFDVDLWFPIIDELNLDQNFRTMIERFSQGYDCVLLRLGNILDCICFFFFF
jgi:pseudouridine-5'-phosphate glycosidase/pseudouridine kinase